MIRKKRINYIKINRVLSKFNELTGWIYSDSGIWHSDFTKKVYDVKFPNKDDDAHVLEGPSKYAYYIEYPQDYLDEDKILNESVESLATLLKQREHVGKPYFEIEFITIVLWLMRKSELEVKPTMFHKEW